MLTLHELSVYPLIALHAPVEVAERAGMTRDELFHAWHGIEQATSALGFELGSGA